MLAANPTDESRLTAVSTLPEIHAAKPLGWREASKT